MQKMVREMEGEVNDLKDDLDSERKDRQRADKQRKDLSEELEALKTELEETTETGAVQQQVWGGEVKNISHLKCLMILVFLFQMMHSDIELLLSSIVSVSYL